MFSRCSRVVSKVVRVMFSSIVSRVEFRGWCWGGVFMLVVFVVLCV